MPLNAEIFRHQMNATIERWKALGASDEEVAGALICGAIIAARRARAGKPGVLGWLLEVLGDAWEAVSS
jgi:hypothetical protein